MNIVIRADSALHIGTGHVMRCLVLASELNQLGHNVEFLMWRNDADLTTFVQDSGFSVRYLNYPNNAQPQFDGDYKNWLPVSEEQDAEQCILNLDNVENTDLIIVDHYSLDYDWEDTIKSRINCKIFAIDDLKRRHKCDGLLDQTLTRSALEYSKLCPPDSVIFTDTQFALLKPEFAQLKQQAESTISQANLRLLVSMGGIDNTNITLEILQQLVSSPIPEIRHISVVINSKSPHFEQVKLFCKLHSEVITLYDFINDMPNFMNQHHLAIGAPGGTTWERASLGIPSIVIPIANNQHDICHILSEQQLAEVVLRPNISSQLMTSLKKLIHNYEVFSNKNRLICDGLGAKRISAWIHTDSKRNNFCRCRLATAHDIDITYQWQCLPETRKFSLSQKTPTFAEHSKWMANKLQMPFDYYYVIEASIEQIIEPVGVVRLDKQANGHYLISIYIAPSFFGRGIASQALQYIDIVHPNLHIEATVLKENLASQALFTKARYHQINIEQFERPPIR